MKNILKYFIAFSAIFGVISMSGWTASAQDGSVKYDKTVSGPDANGVYTISLEAYVTGSVTVTTETAPADIILVLDRSGSMQYDISGNNTYTAQNRRINILKSAVRDFVETVKTSNSTIEEDSRDNYGGHRIAIVWFSGQNYNGNDAVYTGIAGLNTFQQVENLTTAEATTGWNSYTAAKVNYNGNDLLNVSASGGTMTNGAMQRAKSILGSQDYSDKPNRSRVVVFFTDGQPGSGNYGDNWTGVTNDLNVANGCIQAAYDIKNSSEYGATVYSVGMFQKAAGTEDATTTYLSYTSSDFTDKTQMPNSSGDYVAVTEDKSIVVSSAGALSNVFSSIASSAGGDYTAASFSSVLVDIVANSFSIPENTALGSVKVYQVACTQASKDAIISWSSTKTDITSSVTLTNEDNEVTVTGFDYGANWCGWDESANNNTGGPHGYKLVLEIPITINGDAVGGPSVETNSQGSKLVIKDADGNEIASYDFISPTLKIPVQIWIQKNGLQGNDNAVFTIYSTPFVDDLDVDNAKWTSFTKVMITKDDTITLSDGSVVTGKKIVGLNPDYFYKIKEDGWAWTYTYQKGGVLYTVGEEAPSNPFVFVNVPTDVKFDEASYRNVFSKKE